MPTTKPILRILGTLAVLLGATLGMDAQKKDRAMEQQVFYRTVKVDGLSIFYREAGPKGAPPFFYCTAFRLRRGCFNRC
jgi:hypothetical protein